MQTINDTDAHRQLAVAFKDLIIIPDQLPATDIEAAKKKLNLNDSNSVLTYGVDAQREITSVSESLLTGVRNRDLAGVTDGLNKIVLGIRGLNVGQLSEGQGFVSRMLHKATPIARFLESFDTIEHQIELVVGDLMRWRDVLLRSVQNLDLLYRETGVSAIKLEVYIAAAKEVLNELDTQVLPELKHAAEQNENPMKSQEYSDAVQKRDRLDRKINDFMITRTITIQNLPSIRMTQDHDVALVEKINSTIVNTIPLWKRQTALALEGAKTLGAAQAVNAVTDTTNDLILQGAKMLGKAQVESRKAIERQIVDPEVVQQANEILIQTISDVQKIASEARTKRNATEGLLIESEKKLKQALLAANDLNKFATFA